MADYLLAAAVDHLAAANWMTATLHRDEDEEPLEYPDPVPRPGATDDAGTDAGPDPDADSSARAETAEPAAPSTAANEKRPPRAEGPSPTELARFFG